jgi:hypothetical protein
VLIIRFWDLTGFLWITWPGLWSRCRIDRYRCLIGFRRRSDCRRSSRGGSPCLRRGRDGSHDHDRSRSGEKTRRDHLCWVHRPRLGWTARFQLVMPVSNDSASLLHLVERSIASRWWEGSNTFGLRVGDAWRCWGVERHFRLKIARSCKLVGYEAVGSDIYSSGIGQSLWGCSDAGVSLGADRRGRPTPYCAEFRWRDTAIEACGPSGLW